MKSFLSLFDLELLKNVAIFSLIYQILFNIQLLYYFFWNSNISVTNNLINSGYYFLYSFIGVYVLFLGLAISRIVNFFSIIFLFISGAISSYYFYTTKTEASYLIVGQLLNSHIINLLFDINFVGIYFYIWLVISFGALFCTIKIFGLKVSETYFMKAISFICLIIAAFNIVHPAMLEIYNSNPFNYLNSIFLHYTI
jgi:hypothetical protein